jgi:LemA protein
MPDPMNTLQIVTLLVIAVLLSWAVGAYNRVVEMRNAIASAYAQIETQLRRRHELVPQLVEVLRPALHAEHGTFDAVLAASAQSHAAASDVRMRPGAAQPVAALALAEQVLAGMLARLYALLEQHPEQGHDAVVAGIVAELTAIAQKVEFARQLFNAASLRYNEAVHQFPTSMLAPLFRFAPAGQL